MYPKLYNNQFKRGTRRLGAWNYNWESIYFITICTDQKQHFFGKVINKEMVLNLYGQIAYNEWFKTQEIRKDMNVELFDFVIMPNHMHAIIKIGWNQYNTQIVDPNDLTHPQHSNESSSCAMHRAATAATGNGQTATGNDETFTRNNNEIMDFYVNSEAANEDIFASSIIPDQLDDLISLKKKSNNKFGPQAKNLASVIRGFKSAVTTQIRILGNQEFKWQSRFHEHIVRDDRAFKNIQRYIINNPGNWAKK